MSIQPIQIYNHLDDLGLLVDVNRLPEEKNASLKHRIKDAGVHRSNATYNGLINAITRDLNLRRETILRVKLRDDIPTNTYPRIIFGPAWVVIWSNLQYVKNAISGTLDLESSIVHVFDMYEKQENTSLTSVYYLKDLVEAINNTNYYTIQWIGSSKEKYESVPTRQLINNVSDEFIYTEFIPGSLKFKLKNKNIMPGSVFFSESQIFQNERDIALIPELNPSLYNIYEGDYIIDYNTGLIQTVNLPSGNGHCFYIKRKTNFLLEISEASILDYSDESVKSQFFDQILLDNNETMSILPKRSHIEHIEELISVAPSYWGD